MKSRETKTAKSYKSRIKLFFLNGGLIFHSNIFRKYPEEKNKNSGVDDVSIWIQWHSFPTNLHVTLKFQIHHLFHT